MSNFKKVWTGKRKTMVNVSAMLFLIILTVPRLFTDIQLMIMYSSGKPWYDLVCSLGLSCNIGIWDVGVFIADLFLISWVIAVMRSSDPRIDSNGDEKNNTK